MSDAAEKQFEATPSRIAKAKREGNIPRASEFSANAAFIAAALGTLGVIGFIQSSASRAIERAAQGKVPLAESVELIGYACIPMLCAMSAGVVASLVQNG